MSYRSQLFSKGRIYDLPRTDGLFFNAVKESVQWHVSHCDDYRRILASQDFDIQCFNSFEDLAMLPPIPTLLLKQRPLRSLPKNKIHFESTTTGTSGKPVTVGFDSLALLYGANMLIKSLFYHRLVSAMPTYYLILGYQPSKHNQMGAVRTAYGSTFLAPAMHKEYALKDTGTDYALNVDGVVEALMRYSRSRFPVRIHGFPAYLFFLLKKLEQENVKIQLSPKSSILLGGGWKQFSAQRVDKRELYQLAEERLGIPESHFREFFGVVEHNVPYPDCKNHHFHVPIFSRVITRDLDTLQPAKPGEPGLLNLITPLLNSMPLTSILTDDIAILHHGRECGCGIEAPYFEVLGRAGLQGIRTCAAGANSILEAIS